MQNRKQPKSTANLSVPKKGIKTQVNLDDHKNKHPVFSFRFVDTEEHSEWSWVNSQEEIVTLTHFLRDIGSCTWGEIWSQESGGKNRHKKHHFQEFESITQDAIKVLKSSRLDQTFDNLFRFRLGNFERLWGFYSAGTFYILWWDRNHRINPID